MVRIECVCGHIRMAELDNVWVVCQPDPASTFEAWPAAAAAKGGGVAGAGRQRKGNSLRLCNLLIH